MSKQATYRLSESVVDDTIGFRKEVEKYLSGETSANEFKGIRVPMGIYEQRENNTFMIRVRGAAGVFLPHQAKLIAELSKTYGNGIVHVTTRQDLQIHKVQINDTPAILERLLEANLSSRGGGGNTVRNISACPDAGVCSDEVFDVTPYALALTEYLIRDRKNFSLPRKFKAAFSGCSKGCALSAVTDIGFFAHEKDGVRGFAVYAGGGLGSFPAVGILLEEFAPASSIFEITEAVKRLFSKHGDRENRSRARLRFVVQRLGENGFRQAYRDELEAVRKEQIEFPPIQKSNSKHDLAAIPIHLPLGDIAADRLISFAEIASSLGNGEIRTSQDQNLQLRAPISQTENVVAKVRGIDPDFVQNSSVRCVACAGASTCKLGLCLSRGLASAIESELHGIEIPIDAVIRISGCPNSCGQHSIAPLGLFGGSARVYNRLIPFYNIVAGGRLDEGNAAIAETVAKVPAKVVPAILKDFWKSAAENYKQGESLDDLIQRWGIPYLGELAITYGRVPSYDEAPEYYRDFGLSTDFSFEGKGEGECASGPTA